MGFKNEKLIGLSTQLFQYGLFALALGLPLSRFLVSISTIWMALWTIVFVVSGGLRYRLVLNKKALLFCLLIFGVHVIWLIFPGDNFPHAIKDLRIKLPLLIFPLLMVFGPAVSEEKRILFTKIFVVASAASAGVTLVLAGVDILGWVDLQFRDYSPFFSHIRLALNLVLACILLLFKRDLFGAKLSFALLGGYVMALVVLQSVSTLAILGLIFLLFNRALRYSVVGKVGLLGMLFLVGYLSFFSVRYWVSKESKPDGISSLITENGTYVYHNINEEELRNSWNQVSAIPFDSTSDKGYNLSGALVRYLSSKALPKNASGVASLSQQDIHQIEQGVTNYQEPNWWPLRSRLEAIRFQLENYFGGGNPNSNSVGMRFVYWDIALELIKEKPWLGRGVQQLKSAYAQQYETYPHKIDLEFRKRAHNQILTFLVCFGVLGTFLIFLGFYGVIRFSEKPSILGLPFLLVLFCSFLFEDTLETQMGATFAGFWLVWFYLFPRD